MIKGTVWNELEYERQFKKVKAIYPNDIHSAIQEFLDTEEELFIRIATFAEPDRLIMIRTQEQRIKRMGDERLACRFFKKNERTQGLSLRPFLYLKHYFILRTSFTCFAMFAAVKPYSSSSSAGLPD